MHSSFPIFNRERKLIVPSVTIAQLGVINQDYPSKDVNMEPTTPTLDDLALSIFRVYTGSSKIGSWPGRTDKVRINYYSKNLLIYSHFQEKINEVQIKALADFEYQFETFSGLLAPLPKDLKQLICAVLGCQFPRKGEREKEREGRRGGEMRGREREREREREMVMYVLKCDTYLNNASDTELARVLGERGTIVFSDFERVIRKNDRSLREVFKLFDLIHIVTTDHKAITRITKGVVEDFAAENVVYLELRTTPKRNDSIGMSKRTYIEAVLEGLSSVSSSSLDISLSSNDPKKCATATEKKIYVRLLLSIDRRESTAAAMETVKLALEMKDMGIIGINLSGNPSVGEW
nr:adenosine deaminase-like protein [Tanacetum cinerariifolium]